MTGGGWLAAPRLVPRHHLERALEYEQALGAGHAIGLSEDQTREVIEAWVAHYRSTPWPIDWAKVRKAIILRACDEEWRP